MRRAIGIGAVMSLGAGGCNASAVVAPQTVVVPACPEGSAFDASRGFCVAALVPALVEAPQIARAKPVVAPGNVDAGSPSSLPGPVARPANANALVGCDFPNGWVSLLPVAAYPRDDQFLMQSLIGLTQDPKFWKRADPAYAKISAWAAQRCTSAGVAYAVPPGDYWVLAGEEGTFGAKNTYDKNGVRRRVTVPAPPVVLSVMLRSADLTHTWLCISCPWVEIAGVAPFVVLRHRSSRAARGTDTVALTRVPVQGGRLRLRVTEREAETTFLDALVLRSGGRTLLPEPVVSGATRASSPLAAADGVPVAIERGGSITVEYAVPKQLLSANGTADVQLVATGHYEPYRAP